MAFKIGEFFVALNFVTDNKIKDFDNDMQGAVAGINKMKVAFIAAIVTAERFISSTIDSSVAITNFTKQTGLLAENLQRWQVSGVLSDISISADQVASSIQNLQSNITQIRLGGGNVAPFQLLGIDVASKDAFQVLEDIRGAIKGLDDATAVNLIQKAGLSPSFINVLRLSRKEFQELSDVKFLSAEQRKEIVGLGTAITRLKIRMILLKDQAVSAIAPALIKMVGLFSNLFDFSQKVASALSDIISYAYEFKTVGVVLTGIFAAIAASLAPVTFALAALLLFLEDLYVFLEGGDSIIGKLFEGGFNIADFFTEQINKIDTAFRNTEIYKKLFGGDLSGIANNFTGKVVSQIGNQSDILDFATKGLTNLIPGAQTASSLSNNPIFNNTFNLSDGLGGAARNIATELQTQLNYTLDDLNNGNKL